MTKSERINDMMIYLNKKNYFNLKDIMNKYNISRSTALRDINSLENIGMPIYSEKGRNGKYSILNNRILSPIIFTVDEINALYFSMLTLKSYQTTPFHLSLEKLKEKFENCLSREQLNDILIMEKILKFEVYEHNNRSPFLKEILESIIENKICNVNYRKKKTIRKYSIQFFRISANYGQWYTEGINQKTGKFQVFRCDKIVSLKITEQSTKENIMDILKKIPNIYKNEQSIEFRAEISPFGKDLFYKENYPSMRINVDGEKIFIEGFYNKGEEKFIKKILLICKAGGFTALIVSFFSTMHCQKASDSILAIVSGKVISFRFYIPPKVPCPISVSPVPSKVSEAALQSLSAKSPNFFTLLKVTSFKSLQTEKALIPNTLILGNVIFFR